MKLTALLGLSLCASICFAQSATTTYNGTSVVTVVTDASANTYTVTTPLSVVVTAGAPVLVFNPHPPPPPPPAGAPAVPTTATSVSLITQGTWKACEHDAGTPGTAPTCSNTYPVGNIFFDASGKSIDARNFSMSYTAAGGVRWANSFAKDVTSTNFVLDAELQSPDFSHLADLELDTNAVLANGKTAILGTQCASQEKTWDITLSDSTGAWHWVKTNVPCNPLTWTPNVPHHIRIFGTITAQGISTYLGVEVDSVYTAFTGATGSTADPLGWGIGTLLDNVQIDGFGASGSATVYMDKLTVIRW